MSRELKVPPVSHTPTFVLSHWITHPCFLRQVRDILGPPDVVSGDAFLTGRFTPVVDAHSIGHTVYPLGVI